MLKKILEMAKQKQQQEQKKRPQSPATVSTITTVSDSKSGRSKTYTTRVEKGKPKYSFKIETASRIDEAIPEEIEFDSKHFITQPGVLKILEIVSLSWLSLRNSLQPC